MLTSLLHLPSYATCSHGFTWCSMKSIGSVLLCHTALQAASRIITENPKNSQYTSFTYQTIQGRNIPPKRTKNQIWVNYFPMENTRLIIPLSQQSSLTCSSLLCLSETHKCFLHACTPERRTRALAHLFRQCEHGHIPDTKKHILQKNVQ